MRFKNELSTLLLLGSGFLVSSPAMAIASCWEASDPVGCAIQCAVMGAGNHPCPVDAASIRMDVNLPKVDSDQYQKVQKSLAAQISKPSLGERRNGIVKHNLKQTCTSSEMLDVVDKIGLSNPDALIEKCFIKETQVKDSKVKIFRQAKSLVK